MSVECCSSCDHRHTQVLSRTVADTAHRTALAQSAWASHVQALHHGAQLLHPINPAMGVWKVVSFPTRFRRSPTIKRFMVHFSDTKPTINHLLASQLEFWNIIDTQIRRSYMEITDNLVKSWVSYHYGVPASLGQILGCIGHQDTPDRLCYCYIARYLWTGLAVQLQPNRNLI